MTTPALARSAGTGAPLSILSFVEAIEIAGAAKPALEFARLAKDFGAEVIIVTFVRGSEGTESPFVRAARAVGVTVDVVYERFPFDPSILSQIKRIVENRQPKVVHTQVVKSHFLVSLLGLYKKRPWIAFHHGYTQTNLRAIAYNQLNRLSLRRAHQVVAVCGAFVGEIQRAGVSRNRITIQHNSVRPFVCSPTHATSALRNSLSITEDALVLITAGRLSVEKGHVDLIEALAALEKPPNYRLIIIGEGEERSAIERSAAVLGIGDRVHLVGHQPDMNVWYGLADMFILPSHSEGSPNVLLEAMAAEVPIIAMAVGGVPEILTDGVNALLVPKRNTRKLSASIASLMEDATLRERLAANALRHVREYDPEAYCEALLSKSAFVVASHAKCS